jgi:hypothetical protein
LDAPTPHITEQEQSLILSALYGELTDTERAEWERLCAEKSWIAEEYSRLQQTLGMLETPESMPLSSDDMFFAKQWQMLEEAMKSEREAVIAPVPIILPKAQIFSLNQGSMRSWYAVAAMLLVSVGLGISVYRWNMEQTQIRSAVQVVSDSLAIGNNKNTTTHDNARNNEAFKDAGGQFAKKIERRSFSDFKASESQQEIAVPQTKPSVQTEEAAPKRDEMQRNEAKREIDDAPSDIVKQRTEEAVKPDERRSAAPMIAPERQSTKEGELLQKQSPRGGVAPSLQEILKNNALPDALPNTLMPSSSRRAAPSTRATMKVDSSQNRMNTRDSVQQK